MVFKNLKTAEDLDNVARCCGEFRLILLKKRAQFLFLRILNAMVTRNVETPADQENLISFAPWITKSEVLNSRLVCSAWNSAVEKCYTRPVMRGLFPSKHVELKKVLGFFDPNIWANPIVISEPIQAQRFVSQFIDGRKGVLKIPFICRFVILNINEHRQEIFDRFINQITRILTTFGTGIIHLILRFDLSYFDDGYIQIREWLDCMPNLKSLRVTCLQQFIVEPRDFRFKPLPALAKLDHLEVFNVDVNLLNAMFTKYNEVPYVSIRDSKSVIEWSPTLLNNLKGLYVDGCIQHCSDLLELTWNRSQIKDLLVYSRADAMLNKVDFCKLFQTVEKYKSVNNLTLLFEYQVNALLGINDLQLRLPKLRRLEIFSNEYIPIDFIQQLSNLEYLDITLQLPDLEEAVDLQNDSHATSSNESIQFLGFESQMHKSNIWKLLGRLLILKVNIARRNKFVCYEFTKAKSGVVKHERFKTLQHTTEFVLPFFQYID